MKKKIVSMLISMLLIGVTIFSFSGCANKYNAKIINSDIKFQQEFLDDTITYGAYYQSKYFNTSHNQWEEEWLYDETSPESRTYIIKDQTTLEEVFVDFPKTDFEKEMVLVYCYTSVYGRERILKEISIHDEDQLEIIFTIENGKLGHADASMPQRRILVIKMDSLDIKSAEFQYIE